MGTLILTWENYYRIFNVLSIKQVSITYKQSLFHSSYTITKILSPSFFFVLFCYFFSLFVYVCVRWVPQMGPTLRLQGLTPARLLCPRGFSRQGNWSQFLGPPPRDVSTPGTEPRSLALQAYSLPSEPPGRPLFDYRMQNSSFLWSLRVCLWRQH